MMSPITTINILHSDEHSLLNLSFAALSAAIALFVTSLFLPVFITQTHDIIGLWVLAMGWLGFITFQFAWYAMPFTALAVHISKKSPQMGLFLSIIALVMASGAFLFTEVPFGKNDKVLDYGMGFYLWYLCFYLVSFSILMRLVVWSSIEEEAPEIKTDRQNPDNLTSFHEVSPAKAKRKIIAPKVVAGVEKTGHGTRVEPTWAAVPRSSFPPPLPRKNLYQTIKDKKINNKRLMPPPLRPHLVKIKQHGWLNPPPLPKRKKTSQLLALPAQRTDLHVAPFFKN